MKLPKIKWSLKVNENIHNVELVHTYFSGKRKLTVDARVVVDDAIFKDTGSVYEFKIEDQSFKISIQSNFLSWDYSLIQE